MRKDLLAASCVTAAALLALTTSGCTRAALAAPSAPAVSAAVNPCTATAAYAAEITDAGKVAWRVSLPPGQSQGLPSPVVAKGVAVFADNADLVGLRAADGHQLWDDRLRPDSALPDNLRGLWQWGGNAIALIHNSDTDWRLVAVNPADGKVRWQFKFGVALSGLSGVSPDGRMALAAGEQLYVLNLANGRAIWSRPFVKEDKNGNYDAELAITGGVVVATRLQLAPPGLSVMAGFSEKTGHKLWTRTGLPDGPDMQADGRVVLMSGFNDVKHEQVPTPLTAFSAANGKTLWHASVGFVYDVWTAPGQVVFGSRSGMYDVNPVTGAKRWKLSGELSSPGGASDLLLTATDIIYFPGQGVLTDRGLSNGAVEWQQPGVPSGWSTYIAEPSGQNVLVAAGNNWDDPPQTVVSAVNLRTGKLAAWVKLPSDLPAAPAVTDGGAIYQLNPEYCEYAGAAGAGAKKS
jgi:outer membrane protein assembly factor BamB